jgi:hypothetical protein
MSGDDDSLADLVRAYRQADYAVRDGGRREVVARIGIPSQALDRMLGRHGARDGTFITAWNPASVRRSTAANEAASRRLRHLIETGWYRWLPHEGRSASSGGHAADHTWRERGFFVLDLSQATALAWAVRFGQNAIVRVRRGGAPELLLTAPVRRWCRAA